MSMLLDVFTQNMTRASQVEAWSDGELLVTPWTFRDGEPISIYVESHGRDQFLVTDRGQASDNLMVAGLDFGRKNVMHSWESVQRSVEPDLSVMAAPSKWELRGTATAESLGAVMHQVAEAALRADGLRALSAVRTAGAPRFNEWVIKAASDRGLAVVPLAEIRSTTGVRRKVTALIQGRSEAYVQAIGATKDAWEAHDRARSLFMDAEVDARQRFTVIAADSHLTGDQIRSIGQHSVVVEQGAVPGWLDTLAAA